MAQRPPPGFDGGGVGAGGGGVLERDAAESWSTIAILKPG